MDRRNGGDSLAPPRPPKSLPRVHRPRAPEPPMMSASNLETNSTTVILHSCNIPQQIQHQQQPPQFQQQQQQQQQQQLQSHNQICTNNHIHPNRNNNNIINSNINNNLNRPNSSNSNIVNSNINSNNILNNLNSNSNSNNNNNINNNLTAQRAPLTAPLIPLHSSINNNSNISNINLGSTTPSTNLTSSNSFTRRRPQTPVIGLQILPPPTTPLLSSSNLILHSNINNNESSSISPVTLAAPRPENERLSNEYVDTPLRSATTANLHHATRIQHPAGQTVRGQTTTSHNLLHNQRQHLQLHNSSTHTHHHQPQHHQIHFNSTTSHSNNIFNNHNNNISNSNNERHRQASNVPSSISTAGGGSAGSSSGTLRQVISSGVCGIDGSSNTLHSNNISHKNIISSSISGTTCEDSISTTISPTIASITHPPITTTANNQNQRVIPGTVVRQSHQSQQQQSTNHHSSTTLPITEPITKQPAPFTKDCLSASILHEELDLHHLGTSNTTTGNLTSGGLGGNSGNSTNHSDYLNSITCPQCKKCRCEQCQSPRQLPSKWVCNKTCLCSAETVIDYASCLCCVKALFYHCSKDHEMECDDGTDSISCADDPCSCLPHKRATRWGWLGAISLVLPCLWCYWPMRGCIAICAKCYARHSRHGCRCNNYQSQIGSTSSMLPIAPAHGNQIIASKSSGVGSGNNGNGGNGGNGSNGGGCISSGINSNSGSHHQHHFNNSGVSRIIRTNDLTPEKRLLDSSPEF
ncbi:protein sprouty [Condylostylus longicornis]|uniref:protein sprouty n=1 Tax=Condylostylus longicornis TaxID=2530218 RepID=UPI00244DEBEF|nr:protein sprouty [Condylostylus longicornis]XP_055378553.1 protein sprouty [Condylostylus longicornis]XP_055378554.1 protein sprouty [Condylostylus longicornis]XP_055378555.1 protein sprouty [Condylostylus longicornis]XP_055378556.1 protein sprouty [Condylostylus longicornis]XP_055378557.1 protein sprouty [Condylostylus longicornis]